MISEVKMCFLSVLTSLLQESETHFKRQSSEQDKGEGGFTVFCPE